MAKKQISRPINNHVVDVITPIAIEFNQNNLWFGENLAKVFLITHYPSRVKIGWLSRIANMEGVVCSIHLTPTDPTNLIENISKSVGELGAKLNAGGNALMMQRAEQQYKDAKTLLKKIDQEQENVFYVTVALMVIAQDKESLDHKCKKVQSAIAGSSMRGRAVMFKQEEALQTVSPYGLLPQNIKDIASRNMPVSTIAGSFPFAVSGINDGTGYIFGKDASGGILLINNWHRGGDRTNSNWTILGTPGVGKSTTVKHIFLNEWSQGSKIILIDPEREYKEMCENIGGQWINCGGGRGGRINPLQVRNVPLDDEEEEEDRLFKDEGKGMGALALHFQVLRTFFRLYLKDLDAVEMALLEEILEELYIKKFNITWDTDVSKIPNNKFPIMSDLYTLAKEKENLEGITEKKKERFEKIAILLRAAAEGADSGLFNGHTTVEPNSDFIVLDTNALEQVDDTIKRTQYYNILTWTWQQLSHDRSEKTFCGVDEAYLIIDPEVPQALQFLRNFSKRLRKYNGGIAVISHECIDFLDPAIRRHGQALLSNACFKMFMGTDGKDLEELTKLMKLTEAEQEMLSKKIRKEGLLIAGSKRVHAIVEVDDFELELFGKGGGA